MLQVISSTLGMEILRCAEIPTQNIMAILLSKLSLILALVLQLWPRAVKLIYHLPKCAHWVIRSIHLRLLNIILLLVLGLLDPVSLAYKL